MDLFTFDLATIFSFMLTLMRASLIIFMFPVFNMEALPAQWKAAFTLVFTFAIWPHVAVIDVGLPPHPFAIALMLLGELVLGIALGLVLRFFFAGIQAGGELIAMQMGFSMINFADPMGGGGQTGVIAYMFNMVAILLFFTFDGHLYMLKAFVDTYKYIPPGDIILDGPILGQVITLSNMLFTFAIKIIAPILVALFLVEVGLAMMSKVSPQMNIMEMGFPLKILIGFFFVSLIFGLFKTEIFNFVTELDDLMINIIRSMSPIFQSE